MDTALQFDGPAGRIRDPQALWLQRLAAPIPPLSALLVAAHPDDEVVGAGARLAHLRNRVLIVHVTDGDPPDLEDARRTGSVSASAYAAIQRRELHAALALAGLGPESTLSLGVPGGRAPYSLLLLARALATLIEAVEPDVLLTHPFEGGHPDHDATAYAVHRAVALARRRGPAPSIVEFTSYHAGSGGIEPGVFLPGPRPLPEIAVALGARDRALKAAMLDCFASQSATLQGSHVDEERFRIAPPYEFTARPHGGLLWYERVPWGVPWATWARAVEEADAQLTTAPGGLCG